MEARPTRIDLWGKGHRVTRSTEEFQRLVPLRREAASLLEEAVDGFEQWPTLLDSLHKGAARRLPEQYCIRIAEHEAAVVVPHQMHDAHDRPSILIVVVYLSIDWTSHDELINRISAGHALGVRLGTEVAETLSGPNLHVTDELRRGVFLSRRLRDLGDIPVRDREYWVDLLTAVARFRGIVGIATPRMAAFGANVVVGTRTEAERAGADGFFDQRSRRLIPFGKRLVTWQNEPTTAHSSVPPSGLAPDLLTHVLEMRDRLERVEASVDRIADVEERLEAVGKEVSETNRRVEVVDRRVEQVQRQSQHTGGLIEAMFNYFRSFFPK